MVASGMFVVCYDIVDDRLRAQAARRMLDYGTRIQDSVYECILDPSGYERLLRQIEQFPLADDDKIRVYRICSDCLERVRIYGKGELTTEPDFYLV